MPGETDQSIWLASTPDTDYPALSGNLETDVVIVGGGITGLTAALKLKRAGRRVMVLEKERIVKAETGHTTAHLTEAIDARFQTLSRDFGEEGARLAAAGSREAIDFIEAMVREKAIACDFERLPGYLFTEKNSDEQFLRKEAESATKAGVSAEYVSQVPLPFATHGAVRFNDQAQFHPRRYLLALAAEIPGNGCHIFENTRIADVADGDPCRVETDRGIVTAREVFVAAHVPINDWVAIHTKIAAYRSYAIAVETSIQLAHGLFWDTEDPYHYIRTLSSAERSLLIVGGEDHRTGMEEETERRFQAVEEYARKRFSVRRVVNRWSGQIIEPVDGLPYTGRNTLSKHVWVATGYAGQGMTFGTLSGMVVSDLILGKGSRYEKLLDATRIKPAASAKDYIKENVEFPRKFILDRILRANVETHDLDSIGPDEGKIVSVDGKKLAVFRGKNGEMEALSPVCPHLKCDVHWNQHERSWDCPCHGSRFATDGKVLNGPAVDDLKPVDLEELEGRS